MLRFFTYAVFTGVVSWFTCTGCQANPIEPERTAGAAQADEQGNFCGGIANIKCPEGYQCVDDPTDNCDPKSGGADCDGICIPVVDCDQPDREYISNDPDECKSVMILCDSGMKGFADECGCGCEPLVAAQPVACGNAVCGTGKYCCNASCGTCAFVGEACSQIACQ